MTALKLEGIEVEGVSLGEEELSRQLSFWWRPERNTLTIYANKMEQAPVELLYEIEGSEVEITFTVPGEGEARLMKGVLGPYQPVFTYPFRGGAIDAPSVIINKEPALWEVKKLEPTQPSLCS